MKMSASNDRRLHIAAAACALTLVGPLPADAETPRYPERAPIAEYMMASAAEEVALARTAAPPAISGAAEVLVLGPRGYGVAVKGSNGFVCLVERSWDAEF